MTPFGPEWDCPMCGSGPATISFHLRTPTQVTCERSHQWSPDDRLQILEPGAVQLKVAGKPFRCRCGGNVFRKNILDHYVCNSCGTSYEGTPTTKERP